MPTLRYCINNKTAAGCAQNACPAFCGPDINGVCYKKGYGYELTNKLCDINDEYMCPLPLCTFIKKNIEYSTPVPKNPSLVETYSIFPYQFQKN